MKYSGEHRWHFYHLVTFLTLATIISFTLVVALKRKKVYGRGGYGALQDQDQREEEERMRIQSYDD